MIIREGTCSWSSRTRCFCAVTAWKLGRHVSQDNPLLLTFHTPICSGFNPFPFSAVFCANFETPVTRFIFLVSFDGASTKASFKKSAFSVRSYHSTAQNPQLVPHVSQTVLRMVHQHSHDLFPFGLVDLISSHLFPLLQPQSPSCHSPTDTRHLLGPVTLHLLFPQPEMLFPKIYPYLSGSLSCLLKIFAQMSPLR